MGGAEGRVRSHMYVTIALNAYGNGRRGRSLYWLARGVREWPLQALDARFLGGLLRALLGQKLVGRLRPARPGRYQASASM